MHERRAGQQTDIVIERLANCEQRETMVVAITPAGLVRIKVALRFDGDGQLGEEARIFPLAGRQTS
jgi:hypothetical protein